MVKVLVNKFCPVGADMFFEVEDAFIHIDLKTVQTRKYRRYYKYYFRWKKSE
jgi:hypothetical protein